ncbi:MAG: type II secretion system protein, partial [Synergistaceae bacterium]|nr:type II secretion system protein [Synergistaceae bacterium]
MTSSPKKRGFTLIEILVAVSLTGILTALALAPVVVSVRRAVQAQEDYSDEAALSRTMN